MKQRTQQSMKNSMTSERRLGPVAGVLAVLLLPLFVVLIIMAAKFQRIWEFSALDHSQVARHIAAGDGFVTSVVRPLSAGFQPQLAEHADFYNAPLHPLLLAAAYLVGAPSDKVTALAGLGLWVLTVWLTFLVARKWLGGREAGLAVVMCGGNIALLGTAASGLSEPLMAIWVLLATWLVFPDLRGEERMTVLPPWRIVLAGSVCALAFLTDYLLVVVALVVGIYVVATQTPRRRALALFAGGLVLTLLPWMWRSMKLMGSPLFSLYWYELLGHTNRYSGDSVWRMVSVPQHPLLFILGHPRELARKLIYGLTHFRNTVMGTVDPVAGFIFLTAILGGPHGRRRNWLHAEIVAGVLLVMGAACLFQTDSRVLLAWLPLVAIAAAWQLSDWVQDRIGKITLPIESVKLFFWRMIGWWTRRDRLPSVGPVSVASRWPRALVYTVVIGAMLFPLLLFVTVSRATPDPTLKTRLAVLIKRVPKEGTVLTDQPAFVAWYANRTALLIPQHEEDFDSLSQRSGPVDAMYITPALGQVNSKEYGEWWFWVRSPRGVYRGLAPVTPMPLNVVLRIRQDKNADDVAALELLRAPVRKDPTSDEAHRRLAQECLRRNHLREAVDHFRDALRLDAQDTESVYGLWQALAQVNYDGALVAKRQRLLQLNPADPVALAEIQDTTRLFEDTLATRPRDPWLMLTVALCQAKLQHWERAEKLYRTISRYAPAAVPLGLLLGQLYAGQGLLDEAATEFQRVAEQEPRNAAAHEALGAVLANQGQLAKALEEFSKAQGLHPSAPGAYLRAAAVNIQLQDYAKARQQYSDILHFAPQSVAAQLGLAEVSALQGKTAEAIALYEQVLTGAPDHVSALTNLANLYAESGQNFERGIELARRAAKASPTNSVVRDTLGWVYYRAQRYDDAVANLQEAARLSPQSGLVQYHLAKALLAAGHRREAGETFRIALKRPLPATAKADAEAALAAP